MQGTIKLRKIAREALQKKLIINHFFRSIFFICLLHSIIHLAYWVVIYKIKEFNFLYPVLSLKNLIFTLIATIFSLLIYKFKINHFKKSKAIISFFIQNIIIFYVIILMFKAIFFFFKDIDYFVWALENIFSIQTMVILLIVSLATSFSYAIELHQLAKRTIKINKKVVQKYTIVSHVVLSCKKKSKIIIKKPKPIAGDPYRFLNKNGLFYTQLNS